MLHLYSTRFLQSRFPSTCYATLCFPLTLRQFSKRSSFLGRMKPGSSSSSPRRQIVKEDKSLQDVVQDIRTHTVPALGSNLDGVQAHITMQPHSPIKQRPIDHNELSGEFIFQKKNKTSDIELKYKVTKSRPMADSEIKPIKRKSIRRDDKEASKSKESFDICPRREKKNAMSEENTEQNWIEKYAIEEKSKQVLGPGFVLLKKYLPIKEQVRIVKKCRQLGLGPGGFYQPGYSSGAKLRLRLMCLGKNWDPQTLYNEKHCKDGSLPPDIPRYFTLLVKRTLEESNSLFMNDTKENLIPNMTPDVCIVNFYDTDGRLGLHQDRDESEESLREKLPVVSFSVGDSAEFFYGDQRDVKNANNVLLESGDVLIFGGKSRLIFHGVTSIIKGSAPVELLERTKLRPGRLNLTFRQY